MLPLMSAETPQSRKPTDNLKNFPDIQRGESDILEKEYVHSKFNKTNKNYIAKVLKGVFSSFGSVAS